MSKHLKIFQRCISSWYLAYSQFMAVRHNIMDFIDHLFHMLAIIKENLEKSGNFTFLEVKEFLLKSGQTYLTAK